MLYWCKWTEAKNARTNFTFLYFVYPNSLVFPFFNSNILYFIHLFDFQWSFAIVFFFCFFFYFIHFFDFRSFAIFFFFFFFFNVLFRVIDYFGKTFLLLSCWFHCVDIFYIKFIFFETFTETYSVTKLLLIETLSNFRNIKCSSTLNLYMYVLL